MRKTVVVVCLAGAILAWGAVAGASEAVSGRVFLDANNNGKPDAGEKGIAGVRVTDGVSFVTSGQDGAYTIRIGKDATIPYRPAQVVSMSWPSGKWPTGRWSYRLSTVTNAKDVHFGLRDDKQTLPFMYLHQSDAHEHFMPAHKDFAGFVNGLGGEVKFILDTGDTFRLKEGENPFKVPFFYAIGNHDVYPPDAKTDLAGYGGWTRELAPVRWSFDYAGIHVAGVDVTGDLRNNTVTADWLERDFEALRPGTRIILAYHYPDPEGSPKFLKLLKDYKVELVHAGHNHAYVYWDNWVVPMITAYHYSPPGTANAMVVSKDGIDIAFYCIGCKRIANKHSRRCPMRWADHILPGHIQGLFTKLHKIENRPLAGPQVVKVSAPAAFIQARINPGRAEKVGLKIGPGSNLLEIAFTGDHLTVAGTTVPFRLRPQDKTLDVTVFADKNMLTIWANGYFFFEKPVTLAKAGYVTAFAAGGKATIETLTVQEVKADPSNKDNRYRCACAHGALRRTP